VTFRNVFKKKVMTGLTLGIIFTSSLSLTSVMHRDIISVHVPIGCRNIKDVSIILQEYNCENIVESSGCVSGVFMLYEIRRH